MRRVVLIGVVALIVAFVWRLSVRTAERDETAESTGATALTGTPSSAALDDAQAPRDARAVVSAAPLEVTTDAEPRAQRATPTSEENLAEMSGVLVIPAAWEQHRPRLRARSIDAADSRQTRAVRIEKAPSVDGSDVWRWRLAGTPVGRYQLRCMDPLFAIEVDLPVEGRADIRMEIPPPAEVSVLVVDSVSGLPIDADSISWVADLSLSSTAWDSKPNVVERDPKSQEFVFRCVPGKIELDSVEDHTRFSTARLEAEITAGRNALVVKRVPPGRVCLSLWDGAEPVQGGFKDIEFDLVAIRTSCMDRGIKWGMTKTAGVFEAYPGSYTMRVTEPPVGYALPDEQSVEVVAGQTTDVVIRLTRKL
jgi:hypothetical protein